MSSQDYSTSSLKAQAYIVAKKIHIPGIKSYCHNCQIADQVAVFYRALRHKIGVKRTGTALGPVSVFEHKHKMETRTDHTMVSVKY